MPAGLAVCLLLIMFTFIISSSSISSISIDIIISVAKLESLLCDKIETNRYVRFS